MESGYSVNPLASKGVLQYVESYKPEKSREVGMESGYPINPLASKGVLQFVESYKPEESHEIKQSSKHRKAVSSCVPIICRDEYVRRKCRTYHFSEKFVS